MHRPLIIGITGGIGSGKSTLSELLRAEGYSVYDSDLEARRLQNEHSVMRRKMVDLFGEEIYTPRGLNRQALAELVFSRPDLLLKLNNIVHPLVMEDFNTWVSHRFPKKILFIESAILFESGFDKLVDLVILITASEEVRIERVMKRDGVTAEYVKSRMGHQLSEEEKMDLSDFVIRTDDNKPLEVKMRKIIKELLQRRTDEMLKSEI
ncbi:MAG: dephospho-CoA kinase [Bacteroidota bacterium]|nr:dephospho-CoA kinase [Bacteroidota bacterium]